VEAFIRAIVRRERAEHLALVSACRAAQYDEKGFKQYIKGLNDGE
jgi:hypothetical protein